MEGINNWGEIVGSYKDSSGLSHGFISANIVASAAGQPDVLRDLLPGWLASNAAQIAGYGSSWQEQHPSGPAMFGALETQVAAPYAVPSIG